MPDMADLQRIVETRFMLKEEMSEKLHAITESLEKLHETEKKTHEETAKMGEKFDQFAEKVDSAKERVIAFAEGFGIAFGGMELAKKFVEANSEAENFQRTLGALTSASYQYYENGRKLDPAENFRRSMETGKKMHEEFQEAAMKSGLSTASLAQAASTMLPSFAKAKVGTKEASEEIIKLGMLSRNAGKDLGETSSALNMFLMMGIAGKHNPVMSMLGLHSMPNASAETRFEIVNKALKKFNVDSMSGVTTFSDRVNMLKARMENIYELGGKPFFDVANTKAAELADWLEKNQDYVVGIAREIGDKFVVGLKVGGELLKFAAEHAEMIRAALFAIAANKLIVGTFSKINESLEKFGEVAKGGSSLGEAFGTKVGKASAAAMLVEAALIGYAIGTAINGYLEKQEWWKKFMTPGETARDKLDNLGVSKAKSDEQYRKDETFKLIQDYSALNKVSMKEAAQHYISYLGADKRAGLGHGFEASAKFFDLVAHERGIFANPIIARAPQVEKDREVAKRGDMNFYNARFDIKQMFAEGFDPDRIAVAMTNEIASLGERKLQSGLAPVGGVR